MEAMKDMYVHLCNAVTDAIRQLDAQNYGLARELLAKAQQETEEMFLEAEGLAVHTAQNP